MKHIYGTIVAKKKARVGKEDKVSLYTTNILKKDKLKGYLQELN